MKDATNIQEFYVGQTLFYIDTRHGAGVGQDVTVTQIGKRWIYTSDGRRFDRISLRVDGGKYISPGFVVLSRTAYEAKKRRDVMWGELRLYQRISCIRPDQITEEDMRTLAEMFEIPLS